MASRSTRQTVFAVQAFSQERGGVSLDKLRPARSAQAAASMAEKLSKEKVGVVAFSRCGDPDLGEYDDPVVIARFGDVPYEFSEIGHI